MNYDHIFGTQESPASEGSAPSSQEPVQPVLSKGNDNDRLKLWKQAEITALTKLYNYDPYVRADLDASMAKDEAAKRGIQKTSDNILFDEHGSPIGIKHNVASGPHATNKNQTELMEAIRADVLKKYGVTKP